MRSKLLQNRRAPFADSWVLLVLSDVDSIVPAALALFPRSRADFNGQRIRAIPRRRLFQRHLRNDEQVTKFILMPLQDRVQRIGSLQPQLCLQALADLLLVARVFQYL